MRVESSITLPVDSRRAWELMTDWERQPEWMRDADRVEVLTPHREGSGVRIAVKTSVLGIPMFTEVLETITWEPFQLIVVAHSGFVSGVGIWRFEPDAGRTRVTWTEDLSMPIPLLGRIALAVYRPLMRRLMAGSLESFRRRATSSPRSRPRRRATS